MLSTRNGVHKYTSNIVEPLEWYMLHTQNSIGKPPAYLKMYIYGI